MTTERRGLYYEQFELGAQYRTAARRLAAAEIDAFAALSGDRNRLHLDDAYAQESGFAGRIAHGVLGLAVVTGLLNQLGLTRGTLLAFLGLTWSFVAPVYPDDELHAQVVVARKRESSKGGRGVVTLDVALVNQRDAVVQKGEVSLLVRTA